MIPQAADSSDVIPATHITSLINTASKAPLDPFLDYTSSFHLLITPECPNSPSESHSFIYKLPKVRINDVKDDKVSVHTFPVPLQPGLLIDNFLEKEDNLLDDIQVLLDQDELLATSPVTYIHDNYPQPWPPQDFHEKMAEHATYLGLC